jgi:Glycosyltransferase family 87
LFPVAACLAFCMWFYVAHVLVPYEVRDASAHQRPRGNLSDLYPRWLGARELWLHHRNPYSDEVTRDIQAGYYGRPLNPLLPNDPGDQQGFAYPPYVTFLLLPTLQMPFEAVRVGFTWLLVALTASSVWLWFRALRWAPGWQASTATVLLTVGSFAGLQGVKLQQLSLVVAALIAACAALLAGRQFFAAGMVLALATIKPQLVFLLVAYLLFWTLSEWRKRSAFFLGFALTFSALCLGAQWLLPGWIGQFLQAMRRYQQYTGGQSRLDVLLGPVVGKVAAVAIVLALAFLCARIRRVEPDHENFSLLFATILTSTLLVMPNFAPYNELLLLPALLLIARAATECYSPRALRGTAIAAGFFLSWGWLAAIVLTLASLFLPPTTVQRAWAVPLWSEFAIAPSVLLALAMLLQERAVRATTLRDGHPLSRTDARR